jgi:hypothetical protein
LKYEVTPMIGGVVGRSNGIAPGVEFTLSRGKFELYSESEFLFDFAAKENNFYYNWSDLTYSPTDWLWFGVSAQRTRVYKTDLDLQRGVIIGAGLNHWKLTTYFYDIGHSEPFLLVTASAGF